MQLDRIKEGAAAFVQAQTPGIDYLANYGGAVVAQGGPNSFDFQPDDPRIPGMSGIPVKLPFPGFSLQLDPTASPRAMVGWDGGDPSKPELRLWEAPGLAQLTMQASQSANLVAPAVNLGSFATQPLVLGTIFTVALTTVMTAIAAGFTAAGAGFAALAAFPALAPVSAATGAAGTACVAAATAITTFLGTLSQSLSTVSKTA